MAATVYSTQKSINGQPVKGHLLPHLISFQSIWLSSRLLRGRYMLTYPCLLLRSHLSESREMSLLAPTLDREFKMGIQTSILAPNTWHDAWHDACETIWPTDAVFQRSEQGCYFPCGERWADHIWPIKHRVHLYAVLRVLSEKSHLSSNLETTVHFLTNPFSGTPCSIYRFKLSSKSPLTPLFRSPND